MAAIHDAFQANLRRRLAELGIRQKDLAERLNCTEAYVSQLLSGHTHPGLEVLEKVAKALDTQPGELISA
jgi:transcriptional regulator with XRE-family HTH domain